ncbi:MAG TPA: PfkB family carbohydrate kinase [Candidatus Omnitrophota bacterium]|nr:PfkB family carbohydrate kinase [Candidatus Omnitrophota bacterium]
MSSKTKEAKRLKVDHFAEKIKSLNTLEKTIAKIKKSGKKVVHCHGVFDLMHPGHIHHFYAARKKGDYLVVTLTKDEYVGKGPGRPVFNQRLRAESVAAVECVDYVAINEWPTAVETIRKLKPNFYVKGIEYAAPDEDITGNIRPEREAVESIGGKLVFTDEVRFSSSNILNTYFSVFSEETRLFLQQFHKRYSEEDVIKHLKDLEGLKILVIGDTIIDEYHYCKALGKSPKETMVTTKYLNSESFAGGVLACANHAASFCGNVDLVTCLGRENSHEEFIRKHLKPNIKPHFFYRENAPTIVKRRFVEPVFLSKMFQVSFLEDSSLPPQTDEALRAHLLKILPKYDAVLVADYGHGFLSPATIALLGKKAKFLAVNTQTNSANLGFNLVTKYRHVDYICIDEPEIRLAMHDKSGPLEPLIERVSKLLKTKMVMITRGHLGSIAHRNGEAFAATPIFSSEIVDRVGAGDAFFAVTAPCAAKGYPSDLIGFIGNAVGAMAVRIVCNRSFIESVPLCRFISTLLK